MTVGGCAGASILHRSCQALSARLSASNAFPPGTVCMQDGTQISRACTGVATSQLAQLQPRPAASYQ